MALPEQFTGPASARCNWAETARDSTKCGQISGREKLEPWPVLGDVIYFKPDQAHLTAFGATAKRGQQPANEMSSIYHFQGCPAVSSELNFRFFFILPVPAKFLIISKLYHLVRHLHRRYWLTLVDRQPVVRGRGIGAQPTLVGDRQPMQGTPRHSQTHTCHT